MIKEENLVKLYDAIIDGKELTTKVLNEMGFVGAYLTDLVNSGEVTRVKRGLYEPKNTFGLYEYGISLSKQKEFYKSEACFERCLQYDSTNIDACLQLLLNSIYREDYEKTVELCDLLLESGDVYYKNDAIFYLYLLSNVTTLQYKHINLVKCNNRDDIYKVTLEDKKYKDAKLHADLRKLAYTKSFALVLKKLNDYLAKDGELLIEDLITKKLLQKVIQEQTNTFKDINEALSIKNYEKIKEILENIDNTSRLSAEESICLVLCNKIIDIQNTGIIKDVKKINPVDLAHAIRVNNYEKAKELASTYPLGERQNICLLKSLVNDWYDLIIGLKEKNDALEEEISVSKDESLKNTDLEENEVKQTEKIDFSNIISLLTQNKIEEALTNLSIYLNQIDKNKYEFLIVDLIKISLLEKDLSFYEPMLILALIDRNNYEFELSKYVQEFYIAISQNKFEQARLYLEIISNSKNIGAIDIVTDGLYKVLCDSEKKLNYKLQISKLLSESGLSSQSLDFEVEKLLRGTKKKYVFDDNAVLTELQDNTSNTKTNLDESLDSEDFESTLDVDDDSTLKEPVLEIEGSNTPISINPLSELERKFLSYYKKLPNNGIALLGPMTEDKSNKILEIAGSYEDVLSYIITDEFGDKRIMLKYCDKIDIDHREIYKAAKDAYANKEIDKSIELNLKLLKFYDAPTSNIYAILGISFMKKKNIPLAIEYLTVANHFVKEAGLNYDYENLLLRLKGGKIDKEDLKSNVKINISEYDDTTNYYGINNFDEIDDYIIETGLDVETACYNINLSLEETQIIKLIYAREYYIQGLINKGDQFFKSVEKSKDKTKKVIQIMEEIRKNKKFYQTRTVDNLRPLVFTLKPSN